MQSGLTLCGCCPRANAQQPKLFVGMILILIFAEALALYGLIGKICSALFAKHWLQLISLQEVAWLLQCGLY